MKYSQSGKEYLQSSSAYNKRADSFKKKCNRQCNAPYRLQYNADLLPIAFFHSKLPVKVWDISLSVINLWFLRK